MWYTSCWVGCGLRSSWSTISLTCMTCRQRAFHSSQRLSPTAKRATTLARGGASPPSQRRVEAAQPRQNWRQPGCFVFAANGGGGRRFVLSRLAPPPTCRQAVAGAEPEDSDLSLLGVGACCCGGQFVHRCAASVAALPGFCLSQQRRRQAASKRAGGTKQNKERKGRSLLVWEHRLPRRAGPALGSMQRRTRARAEWRQEAIAACCFSPRLCTARCVSPELAGRANPLRLRARNAAKQPARQTRFFFGYVSRYNSGPA